MVLNLTNGHPDPNQCYIGSTNRAMNFLGNLSPPASSVDSSDISMNSPMSVMSPNTLLFHAQQYTIVEDVDAPFLDILEQPMEKFRFRYKSEMVGTHGSLTGVNSDKCRKNTYPEVELRNFNGSAIIRCTLCQINNDEPHPHRLVVRHGNSTKDDPHDLQVSAERGYKAVFHGMGIIHTAKVNLAKELSTKKCHFYKEKLRREGHFRELTKLEDTKIKADSEQEAKKINLNIVRLCFEAFCEEGGLLVPICHPVFSHAINNLKSALTGELKIVRMDRFTTSCLGGEEIFILVEKVTKHNIKVRFFECDDADNEIWEDYGKFAHTDVHHQYAIVFKAPPYKDLNIEETVKVFIELIRPTDGARSEPKLFQYKPSGRARHKKMKYNESMSSNELPDVFNFLSSGSRSVSISSIHPTLFTNPENVNLSSYGDDFCKNVINDYYKSISDVELSDLLAIDGSISTPSTSNTPLVYDTQTEMLAKKVVSELQGLFKRNTEKKDPEHVEKIVQKLFNNLSTTDGNTALHTAILCQQYDHLKYILILISKMKQLKIVDIKNNSYETALHLAVISNKPAVVKLLLSVGADLSCVNSKGNTALHIAIEHNHQLQFYDELLKASEILNFENYDGFTPLHLAVMQKNLESVKILVENNVIVAKKHPLHGNTALHMAVDLECTDIVLYLLKNTDEYLLEENFEKISPLQLAKVLSDNGEEKATVIYKILQDYVNEKHLHSSVKVEMDEDESSSDSDEFIIKSEPPSPEHMEIETFVDAETHAHLTEECITKLAVVLDNTEALERLVKALEFPGSNMTVSTRMLLNYVVVTGKPISQVRNFLNAYGAKEAVKIMDEC